MEAKIPNMPSLNSRAARLMILSLVSAPFPPAAALSWASLLRKVRFCKSHTSYIIDKQWSRGGMMHVHICWAGRHIYDYVMACNFIPIISLVPGAYEWSNASTVPIKSIQWRQNSRFASSAKTHTRRTSSRIHTSILFSYFSPTTTLST